MGADAEGQYADTKNLLEYGFNEFENVNISANDSRFYQSSGDAGILTAGSQLNFYQFDAKASLLLPKNTSINDLTTTVIRSMDSSFSMIRYYIGEYYLGEARILEATPKLADVSSPLFQEEGGLMPYKSLPPMEKPGEGLPWSSLGFGYIATDYRYSSKFKDGAWDEGQLITDSMITLSECAGVFQYAQTIFEGLKAYSTKDGHIVCFRPDLNAARMADSAKRLEMPVFPEDRFVDAVCQVVKANQDWVPPYGSGATL